MTQRAELDFATSYRARQRTIETGYRRQGTSRRRGPLLIGAAAILIIGAGAGAYFMGGGATAGLDTTIIGAIDTGARAIDPALADLAQFEGL